MNRSALLIIGASCLWGTMGTFVRFLDAAGLSSFELGMVRCLVTAAVMALAALVTDRQALKIRLSDLPALAANGICAILFFTWCYFKAIMAMPLSTAVILLYTAPIFVMVMSYFFFREALTGQKIVALVLAFGGCVLVSGILTGGGLSLSGLLFGVGAGFGYALYSIFTRVNLNRGLSPLTITIYTFLIAGIGFSLLGDGHKIAAACAHPGTAVLLLVFAAVTTVFPYFMYAKGLEKVETGTASVMCLMEPVTATLLGLLIFHEVPTLAAFIGIGLVFAGLAVLAKKPGRHS